MKRTHYAILSAQSLSYALIITFLFADANYNFTGALRDSGVAITLRSAYIAACLIGLVGVVSIWLTWHYISKSNQAQDLLVICAWTHRVKTASGWIPLETFFSEQLGYAVSHGLSDEKYRELRAELDRDWKKLAPSEAPYRASKGGASNGHRS